MTSQLVTPRREVAKSSVGVLEYGPDGARLYAVAEEARLKAPPTAVLFACENVLYDATVWERWLVRLLRHVQVQIDHESFGRHWNQEFLPEIHCGHREFDEAFRDYLRQLGLARGLIDEVAAASQGRRHEFLREARPLPSIRQTVNALGQQGLALGLLADSDLGAADLEHHLTRLGFGGRFQFLLSSVELGHTKSDAEGYRAATVRFGRPTDRIAFVGSHSQHLATAARLGMPTVAFNYDNQARADLYLRKFDELAAILKSWPLVG
jgi:FMN phosphatase YigB (HAD superfamily)